MDDKSHHPRSFRLPVRIDAALAKACDAQQRTRTDQVIHYLRRGLKEDGLLPEFERKTG